MNIPFRVGLTFCFTLSCLISAVIPKKTYGAGWTATTSMSVARCNHTATLLLDGKVLVTGGYTGYGQTALASTELYDPVSLTWSKAADMATPRYNHTATLLPNGKVLIVGGTNPTLTSAELYDPGTNSWSSAGNMAFARSGHL